MVAEKDESTATLFRVLMHPTRLAILDLLRHGEECVCHMEAHLGKRQAYISQQLMVLREAGLVQDRREGWNSYYYVVKPEVYAVIDAARALAGVAVAANEPREQGVDCPCPKCSPVAVAEVVVQ